MKKILWAIILVIQFFSIIFLDIPAVKAETTEEASLRIVIDKESFFDPNELVIDFKIDPNGIPVNSAGVYLNFNPDNLTVTKVDYTNSFCTLLPEELINNNEGSVRIGCGTPRGNIMTETQVVRLTFQKHARGWTTISMMDDACILKNDGLGTNILTDRPTSNIYLF